LVEVFLDNIGSPFDSRLALVMPNNDGKDGRAYGGGGVVLRHHHGDFVVGASHFFPSSCDVEQAELLACRRAVELAAEVGASKLVLKSDGNGGGVKAEEQLERQVDAWTAGGGDQGASTRL
jgi:ribonuclease HI